MVIFVPLSDVMEACNWHWSLLSGGCEPLPRVRHVLSRFILDTWKFRSLSRVSKADLRYVAKASGLTSCIFPSEIFSSSIVTS